MYTQKHLILYYEIRKSWTWVGWIAQHPHLNLHFLPLFIKIALPVKKSFTSKPVNWFYRFLLIFTGKNLQAYPWVKPPAGRWEHARTGMKFLRVSPSRKWPDHRTTTLCSLCRGERHDDAKLGLSRFRFPTIPNRFKITIFGQRIVKRIDSLL